MAELSQRQKTAAAIAAELHRLGVPVTNPMPLADGSRLRFQLLDSNRDAIISKLAGWGWLPIPCGAGLRFDIDYVAKPVTTYELDLPADRPPIPTERGGGRVEKEVLEFRKALK
jgi:hypothetical protein